MSEYEPVAKRTRLSVSRSRGQTVNAAEEKRRELRMFNDFIKSKCDEVLQLVPKMSEIINNMQKFANNPGVDTQLIEMENNLKAIESRMNSAKNRLAKTEQILELMLFEILHTYSCTQSDECFMKMEILLIQDPHILERKREILLSATTLYSSIENRHSPLHDAVRRGHVKCVKFLLEKGAKVTSVTTENNSVLHTLYSSMLDEDVRLEILKLLLKNGASRMFHHKHVDHLAFQMVNVTGGMEEASLLLHYGATMNEEETRLSMIKAWARFNFPLLKLFLLHCPNMVKIHGPGHPSLCKQLISQCYRKMVLAKVPSSLCHDKLLEALQLYKVFGGKFVVHPWKYPAHNLLRYLIGYRHKRHFNGALSRVDTLVSNPMSLKEISRLAVCKSMNANYVENIQELEVPEDLKPFLRFEDVAITKKPSDFDEADIDDSSSGESEFEDSSSDEDMVSITDTTDSESDF